MITKRVQIIYVHRLRMRDSDYYHTALSILFYLTNVSKDNHLKELC